MTSRIVIDAVVGDIAANYERTGVRSSRRIIVTTDIVLAAVAPASDPSLFVFEIDGSQDEYGSVARFDVRVIDITRHDNGNETATLQVRTRTYEYNGSIVGSVRRKGHTE